MYRRAARDLHPAPSWDVVNEDIRLSMSLMAGITGGRFINYTNEASDGIREAASDIAGSYSLGFYSAGDPDGKFHSITVQAAPPD